MGTMLPADLLLLNPFLLLLSSKDCNPKQFLLSPQEEEEAFLHHVVCAAPYTIRDDDGAFPLETSDESTPAPQKNTCFTHLPFIVTGISHELQRAS